MGDSYTGTSALTDQIKTAYDRVLDKALRANVVFDQFADKRPVQPTQPGSTVTFTLWNDLSAATSSLNETTDPDAVALGDTTTSVTLAEYGNVVITTRKARGTVFTVGFDADVAELVAYNAVDSIDALAKSPLDSATPSSYGGSSSAVSAVGELQATANDYMDANRVRIEHAELKNSKVVPWDMGNDLYVAIAHPHVTYDLKAETGDGAWISPHQYVDTREIYNNEMGTFGGFRFIETPRATFTGDAGSGAVDAYNTYFFGRQALAKAVIEDPTIEIGVVEDKLNRKFPIGWYAFLGYAAYRTAALRLNKSASSLGANT